MDFKSKDSSKKAIISLSLTLILTFILYINLTSYIEGDQTTLRLTYILITSLAIFFIPIAMYHHNRPKDPEYDLYEKGKKESQFQLKIFKRIRLNTIYNKPLIIKCPRCKFENPPSTKKCFNCLYQFYN
jgi:hypothetical protein